MLHNIRSTASRLLGAGLLILGLTAAGEARASEWDWVEYYVMLDGDPCDDLTAVGTCYVDGVKGPCAAPPGSNGASIYGGSGGVIIGSPGPDFISVGGLGDTIICGLGGDDVIYGSKGDDTIYAGPGDDYVEALAGKDIIYGGPGDDILFGQNGSDKIDGGVGHDEIYGGPNALAEYLTGGPSGDDYVACSMGEEDGPCYIRGSWSGQAACLNATESEQCVSSGSGSSFSDGLCTNHPLEEDCNGICEALEDGFTSPDCDFTCDPAEENISSPDCPEVPPNNQACLDQQGGPDDCPVDDGGGLGGYGD